MDLGNVGAGIASAADKIVGKMSEFVGKYQLIAALQGGIGKHKRLAVGIQVHLKGGIVLVFAVADIVKLGFIQETESLLDRAYKGSLSLLVSAFTKKQSLPQQETISPYQFEGNMRRKKGCRSDDRHPGLDYYSRRRCALQ